MSMVDCECETVDVPLSSAILSKAVAPNSKVRKSEYCREVEQEILVGPGWTRKKPWQMTDSGIGQAMRRYSDIYAIHTRNPVSDLSRYIRNRGQFWIYGVGGAWWTLLGYPHKPKIAPPTLIGGIGEGVVGHWLEKEQNMTYILRPVGVCTDGIVQRSSLEWGPIEVKSTISGPSKAKELAIAASRDLLKLYQHHKLHGSPSSTLKFALSLGVMLGSTIRIYCIWFS